VIPELRHYDATTVRPLLDQLVDIYVHDIYADDPVIGNETRFRGQLDQHMQAPNWELVTATLDGEIVGFIYGFTLAADADWWAPLITDVPDGFTTETGDRTWAISELLVRKPWRRRGIATVLHETLLAERSEERATLFVQPASGYEAARAAYRSWGWAKVAQTHPDFDGAPVYDVMVKDLRRSSD
jgi:GNAT superfamily N-acetyltransferase